MFYEGFVIIMPCLTTDISDNAAGLHKQPQCRNVHADSEITDDFFWAAVDSM
jgi:hypothetical protein